MAIVEVGMWLLLGLGVGVIANALSRDRRHGMWLVLGSGFFAFLGGTGGKFVFASPTNVEASFSWISLVLAAIGALLFVWYRKMVAEPTGTSAQH